MKEAGIKMIYSLPHIKVHSKIALVKKGSGKEALNYAILSTGNFNEITAQFYTDHLLMTTDLSIIEELTQLFKYLQADKKENEKPKPKFEKLLVSQFNMTEKFERLVETEIKKALLGGEALVRIKINNLEEPGMISLLYRASQAGVKINLCVRGICCLMPGVMGMSENITIKRLVDQYLEHSRLFIFGKDDSAKVIMGSADWMTRNLYHRIEVCVAIKNVTLKKELVDYFEIQWSDTAKSVELTSALESKPHEPTENAVNAQQSIYTYLNAHP